MKSLDQITLFGSNSS